MQLDKGRGEFDKLSKKSSENLSNSESERSDFVQVKRIEKIHLIYPICRKFERNGILMRQLQEN